MGALALKCNSNTVSMAQTCINAYGESGEMEFETTARKLRFPGATVGDSIKGTQVVDARKMTALARAFTQLLESRVVAKVST